MRYFAVIISMAFFVAADAMAALESLPENSSAIAQKSSSDAQETGLPIVQGGKRFFPLNQTHMFRIPQRAMQAPAPAKDSPAEIPAVTTPILSSDIAPMVSPEPVAPQVSVKHAPRAKSTASMNDDQARQILSLYSAGQ